jgi:hypothetical protein
MEIGREEDPASPRLPPGAFWGTREAHVRPISGGIPARHEVEDRGAEVGEPLLADPLAAEQGGR